MALSATIMNMALDSRERATGHLDHGAWKLVRPVLGIISPTGTPSASAMRDTMRTRDVEYPFSYIMTEVRDTPIRPASTAWVRPASQYSRRILSPTNMHTPSRIPPSS